jgi:glucan phosphoethanolaminetransferase (alkaline phosphatase superfamily)
MMWNVAPASAEHYRRATLAALCVAPVLAMAACSLRYADIRVVVALLLVTALLALLIAGVTRSWRRAFLSYFPFLLPSWAFAAYTVVYGVPPGHALAIVLAGMSWEEAIGFLQLSPDVLAALALMLVMAVTYLTVALRLSHQSFLTARPKQGGLTLRKTVLLVLLPSTAYAVGNPADLIDGIGNSPVIGSVMFLSGTLPSAAEELHGTYIHKLPYNAHRLEGEEVHVLVVGESVRRDSWSAYGYGRRTTPYLDKQIAEGNAILFKDAVADANLTSWSVPIILTGTGPEQYFTAWEHKSAAPNRGNLLDLAKQAGYSTAWLVNQDISISTYVGVEADHLFHPPEVENSPYGRNTLDESLLPTYRKEIARAGKPRFIGIHIMGSHWIYSNRYPKSFRRFGTDAHHLDGMSVFTSRKEDMIAALDAYDTSIAYTDWFLQQLIEQASTLQVPATLTYVPDHGEDLELLDGRRGHGAPLYTQHAFEIPVFVWMNEAYRKAHPDKVAALQRNSSKEIRSHDVFYSIADLMGITWPQAAPLKSFASDKFVPDTATRYIAGAVLVAREQ